MYTSSYARCSAFGSGSNGLFFNVGRWTLQPALG